MTHCISFFLCLATLSSVASAQMITETPEPAASSSPVAFVYVSRPTHIDAFSAASNGKLTLIGSPISAGVSHMSVKSKYLFGMDDNDTDIDIFKIEANGAIAYLNDINAQKYVPDSSGCSPANTLGPIQLDHTGSTLYNLLVDGCRDDQGYQSFKIESNGDLQFLNTAYSDLPPDITHYGPISLLGNDKFAYQVGCASDDGLDNPASFGYKRSSTGALESNSAGGRFPTPKNPEDVYCPGVIAADATDHLVTSLQEYNASNAAFAGPWLLATFTANSEGALSTKSTFENMFAASIGSVGTMSISPSSKLLAIGGSGFQVLHFNGADPVTKLTGKISTSGTVEEFAWDNSDHLYVLTSNDLYVYKVSSTSVTEVAGSPYSIPEASSLIVLNK